MEAKQQGALQTALLQSCKVYIVFGPAQLVHMSIALLVVALFVYTELRYVCLAAHQVVQQPI
jgi:hypothetical protein